MATVENKIFFIILLIFFLSVLSVAQTFEGTIVIKETAKQFFEWRDPELVADEIKQLDHEIKELEIEMKNKSQSLADKSSTELESLKQLRDGLLTSGEALASEKTISIKPGAVRIDYKNQEYSTILQIEKGVAWNIYPEEKGYVQSPLSDFIRIENHHNPVDTLTIQPGDTTVFEGYKCTQLLSIHKNDTSKFYLTDMLNWKSLYPDSLVLFIHFDNNEVARAALPELIKNGGFPIKSVLRSEDSDDVIEVLKIGRKSLPPSLFEIPPDYKSLTLEDVLKEDW